MTPTRRQLLLSGVRLGAGGCVYLALGACGAEREPRLIDISAVLIRPARVRAIGDEYRRQFSDELDIEALEQRVLSLLPGERPVGVEVNQRLSQLIRGDFASERVFLFEGWILSRTEGQLCALATPVTLSG